MAAALSPHHRLYPRVAFACAILCAALFVNLRFAPAVLLELLGLEVTPALSYFAKRAGYLFLGLAVLSFLSRKVTDVAALKAISTGFAVLFIGLVASGIEGYATGLTTAVILGPIAIELSFAILYFYLATGSYR